ncbi:hypothetical protein [Pseudooceanicola sp. 200-1SW]|uniref:hypothetical protein n=1 Tax=Pseudooceanicola sp. 200-1SW TaxID=3425949 RepID=UPI003D7F3AAE
MSGDLQLDVRGCGQSWAVFAGERRVSRYFTRDHHAAGAATRLAERARLRERACLCCGSAFMSQGPHNRLCAPCRRDPLQAMTLGADDA